MIPPEPGIHFGVEWDLEVEAESMLAPTRIDFGVAWDLDASPVSMLFPTGIMFGVEWNFLIYPIGVEPPPPPYPIIDFDDLPRYGLQTALTADPETPAPEHGLDPVPTERWFPDGQYRT